MTESIAISSGKGGVGKTTIAVNLALTAAKLGRRVLLLDADLGMANAHIILGINPEKSLDDFVSGNISLSKIPIRINSKLDFISGGSAIHNMLNLNETERYKIIKSFTSLKKSYDLMIIDVGAGADTSATAFMAASNKNIVIVVPEPTSFVDAYGLMKAAHFDHKIENYGIFVNNSNNEFHAKSYYDRFEVIFSKYLDIKSTFLGSLKVSQKIKNSIISRKPIVSDNLNKEEIIAFENLYKNLEIIKLNDVKGIKFFED